MEGRRRNIFGPAPSFLALHAIQSALGLFGPGAGLLSFPFGGSRLLALFFFLLQTPLCCFLLSVLGRSWAPYWSSFSLSAPPAGPLTFVLSCPVVVGSPALSFGLSSDSTPSACSAPFSFFPVLRSRGSLLIAASFRVFLTLPGFVFRGSCSFPLPGPWVARFFIFL